MRIVAQGAIGFPQFAMCRKGGIIRANGLAQVIGRGARLVHGEQDLPEP